MKSLNQTELQAYINYWEPQLLGSQLQDVWTDGQVVLLELRRPAQTGWLCLDLHPSEPQVVWVTQRPAFPKNPKPVVLFLASHAENRRLQSLRILVEQGRVLELVFGAAAGECRLLFCLVPKFVNLSVFAAWDEEKKGRVRREFKEIHWHKPRQLPASGLYVAAASPRDWAKENEAFVEEWLRAKGFRSEKRASEKHDSVPASVGRWQKDLTKKEKALGVLRDGLSEAPWEKWRRLGEALKANENIPAAEASLVDPKLARFENMSRAFAKAKELERKSLGQHTRMAQLEAEIAALRQKMIEIEAGDSVAGPSVTPTRAAAVMKKNEAKGRKHLLPSGLEVVMGKSAKDNLQILRGARAWDLWLHLRDYPGAHAIIFREKTQTVSDRELAIVGTWIWQQSQGSGHAFDPQLQLDLLVAECRFVRPVKGSPGLVTHQNSRVVRIRATRP